LERALKQCLQQIGVKDYLWALIELAILVHLVQEDLPVGLIAVNVKIREHSAMPIVSQHELLVLTTFLICP
jgi:hypothetical protein